MANSTRDKEAVTRIENIAPILNVKDLSESIGFYVGKLGFIEADWGKGGQFTYVSKDGSGIYLCQDGQGHPGTWVWIGFDGDIRALHDTLRSKGVEIIEPPVNRGWALEMKVRDPDGHVLRFGTDPDE